jgi:hypothetical protein
MSSAVASYFPNVVRISTPRFSTSTKLDRRAKAGIAPRFPGALACIVSVSSKGTVPLTLFPLSFS